MAGQTKEEYLSRIRDMSRTSQLPGFSGNSQDTSRNPLYGGYPPQGGYVAPQQGGFAAPQQGFATQQQGFATQQQGGFATQQQGGFATQQQGGFAAPQQGGFAAPQQGFAAPQQGGFAAPQQGFATQQQGLAAIAQQQGFAALQQGLQPVQNGSNQPIINTGSGQGDSILSGLSALAATLMQYASGSVTSPVFAVISINYVNESFDILNFYTDYNMAQSCCGAYSHHFKVVKIAEVIGSIDASKKITLNKYVEAYVTTARGKLEMYICSKYNYDKLNTAIDISVIYYPTQTAMSTTYTIQDGFKLNNSILFGQGMDLYGVVSETTDFTSASESKCYMIDAIYANYAIVANHIQIDRSAFEVEIFGTSELLSQNRSVIYGFILIQFAGLNNNTTTGKVFLCGSNVQEAIMALRKTKLKNGCMIYSMTNTTQPDAVSLAAEDKYKKDYACTYALVGISAANINIKQNVCVPPKAVVRIDPTAMY